MHKIYYLQLKSLYYLSFSFSIYVYNRISYNIYFIQFKQLLYYNLFGLLNSVVKEEIVDDDAHLPCFNGRVVSWVRLLNILLKININTFFTLIFWQSYVKHEYAEQKYCNGMNFHDTNIKNYK